MPSITCRAKSPGSKNSAWAFFLILITIAVLSGCGERQLIEPTPHMTVSRQFWVRVLLLDNITDCTLDVPSSFRIVDEETQTILSNYQKTEIPIKVTMKQGQLVLNGRIFKNTKTAILPDTPFVFSINKVPYRGNVKFIPSKDGVSFDVVNELPLEAYLAGVVGAEMPSYWEKEALKAQAIAARTYCLYIKRNFGQKRHWDVSPTQSHQVYRGIAAESRPVWDAVDQTTGQVLVCRKEDGTEGIFPTYYSSSCGGHTENSKNVFGDSFKPLTGVVCPYCKKTTRTNYFFWPKIQLDAEYVNKRIMQNYPKLKNLGKINMITPAKQSKYGDFSRTTLVKLIGSSGKSEFLRGEDFRLTLDPTGRKIKSSIYILTKLGDTWAFIAGRGFGHGVGMCQHGAEGMARSGKTAVEILDYYYAGSRIANIY